MKRLLGLCLLCMATPSWAEFYKCTGANGAVNFTDTPCAQNSARAETLKNAPLQGLDKLTKDLEQAGIDSARREVEANQREQEFNRRYFYRKRHLGIRIGMTDEQVLAAGNWGGPDTKNVTETAFGNQEQWIYQADADNEADRVFLYFRRGVLTTIQD